MKISAYLLEKYNVPVPRYTSYPPANHLTGHFTEADALEMISGSNTTGSPNIAIYLHIPFCRRICHYCGCNSYPLHRNENMDAYVEALKKEIKLVARILDKSRKVSQIHYGGGTPNVLPVSLIASINDLIFSEFSLTGSPEIAIECNPAGMDNRYINGLLSSGFNRFSLGIQDFDPSVLKLVNREIPETDPEILVNYIKGSSETTRVNLDFIYGLPGQTVESFSETIRKASKIKPDRLVTFSYAHVPWVKKNQMVLGKYILPSPEQKAEMFHRAGEILAGMGYMPVGLDHFVLPHDDLWIALQSHQLHRNFQGYCTKRTTGQVYAFGVTSISQLENGFFQNTKDIPAYINTVNSGKIPVEKGIIITPEQKIIRDVINDIMCNKRLNFSEFAQKASISADRLIEVTGYNPESAEDLINDGLIDIQDDELQVTETGAFFVRNIASLFDREFRESERKYSNPV